MSTYMANSPRGWAAMILVLSASQVEAASPPQPLAVTWPRIGFERKILVKASARSATNVIVQAGIQGVPSDSAHRARIHLLVRDSSTGQITDTLSSAVFDVPRGDSTLQGSLLVDADGLSGTPLEAGAYTLQALVVAGPGTTAADDFQKIVSVLSRTEGSPPFAIQITKEQGILVLGEELDKVAAYEREIATGKPDLIYRGLSHLVQYHRARGRHDSAEAKINLVINRPAFQFDPALTGLRRVFRTWAADERFLAGDVAGAVALLEEEIASAPLEAGFLGEPFVARALGQLARIKRSSGDLAGAISAYTRLVDDPVFGLTGSALDGRKERGETLLHAGNYPAARADFEYLVVSDDACQQIEEPLVPCPSADIAQNARRWLRLLDSNRAWMRSTPTQVVAELRGALERRDLALLDAIAGRVDFKFGALGGEWQRLAWETVRPFFGRVFREATALELVAPTAQLSGARQYAVVRGLGRTPGLPTGLVFLIDKTPFGWQLGGVGGLYVLGSSQTPVAPSPPPNAPPPPLPGGQDAFVSLKAPWLAGESMQAGGLSFDLDWFHFFVLAGGSIDNVTDLLFDTLIRTDRCGPTMPGFYYDTGPTHQGSVRFAIDFMDGYGPVGCVDLPVVGEQCLPDPRGPLALITELERALDHHFTGGLNEFAAAYGDPVPAAHAGVVVRSRFWYVDGSTEDENRVDVAIWPGSAPFSAPGFGPDGLWDITSTADDQIGSALAKTGAPYWNEYLHLSQHSTPPSVGAWVDQGEVIGLMDDTGESATSHLHFTLRQRPRFELADRINEWQSVRPTLEEKFLSDEDNGFCLRSSNEQVISDFDGDGIIDEDDNCGRFPNPDQADTNGDRVGDACADDFDEDGVLNAQDSCPTLHGTIVNFCDDVGCRLQEYDFDGDGIGDVCDDDQDGDGVLNAADRCRSFPDSQDLDGDGRPDGCDFDDDGDGWRDSCEETSSCGCMPDLFPRDRARAGDPDGDGVDSLIDVCPCRVDVLDCIDEGVLEDPSYFDLFNQASQAGLSPNI